ncbi:MAG TPA: hypothetical protein VI451_02395 [Anaerolineales bacterium]|nr:hypothetical protein [Anaerolineales bacterium]
MLKHPESLTQALERALGGAWLPQALQALQASLRQGQKHLRQPLERLTEAYLAAMIPLPEYQRRRPELKKKLQILQEQASQAAVEATRKTEI